MPRFLLSTNLFHMTRKSFAGLPTPAYGQPSLATARFLIIKNLSNSKPSANLRIIAVVVVVIIVIIGVIIPGCWMHQPSRSAHAFRYRWLSQSDSGGRPVCCDAVPRNLALSESDSSVLESVHGVHLLL